MLKSLLGAHQLPFRLTSLGQAKVTMLSTMMGSSQYLQIKRKKKKVLALISSINKLTTLSYRDKVNSCKIGSPSPMITLKSLSNIKVILVIICVRKDVIEKEIGAALTVSANHCHVPNVAIQIILGIHSIVLRFGVGSTLPLLCYQRQESSYI